MIKKVTLGDLEKSFGIKKNKFSNKFLHIYKTSNFKYKEINDNNEQKLIKFLIEKTINDKRKTGSKKRKIVWQKGWNENLVRFKKDPKNLKALLPIYNNDNIYLRFFSKFIIPKDSSFEHNYFRLLQQHLFDTYFKKYNNFYEFGSGTGLTALSLANNFPEKKVFATDFVKSSVQIIKTIAKHYNKKIYAEIFDIKKPNYKYEIKDKSLIFTLGAIEQVKDDYKDFIDYILKKKPKLVINMEPYKEAFDLKNHMDLLSYAFIEKRKYANNFLPYLKELEKKKKIKILKIKRTYFGGIMMESYNYIVWKVI